MKYSHLIHISIYFVISTILLINLVACEQKSEYEQLVEREMSNQSRYDSLFLGYTFGMQRQDFFDHSWQLNQQHLITGSAQVEYPIGDLKSKATMTFFPEFHNNRIYRIPAEIQYDGWAPWNKDLFADSLIVELVDLYEEIYGPGFIQTIHPDFEKPSWIKVDGNRRISIYRKDDMKARIEFLDLSVDTETE